MKLKIKLTLYLVCVMFILQICIASLVYADDEIIPSVDIFEKVEKFDGALHQYNLNDYFEKGEIRYTDYELVEAVPEDVISVSQSILTVAPVKNFKGEAKVKAIDREGDSSYLIFKLKFIEPVSYMISAATKVTIFMFLLLVLVFGTGMYVFSMKNGKIVLKKPDVSDYERVIHTRWFCPIIKFDVEVSRGNKLNGFFLGWDECIRFIPAKGQDVYIKDNINGKNVVVKIKSYPLYFGTDSYTWLYLDKECNDGILIGFQEELGGDN